MQARGCRFKHQSVKFVGDNSGIISFYYISIKIYAVGTHSKRLAEALLICTHNKGFHGELRKIIPELSSNTPP